MTTRARDVDAGVGVAEVVTNQAAGADADIAAVAALLSDRTRAAMLITLLDGDAHSSGDLARQAGVSASTAGGHLGRLSRGGLVVSARHGRERRYRLASTHVAQALEALSLLAPPAEIGSLRTADRGSALRLARTCYDHLAGRLGVGLTDALLEQGALRAEDGGFALTGTGETLLIRIGVDVARARAHRRVFARACLDWTERRPHLAGALGAAVAEAIIGQGWVRKRPHDRALLVTPEGMARLRRLGVEPTELAAVV